MSTSKKNFSHLFKLAFPVVVIIGIVCAFFYRTLIFSEVPIPGDLVIGTYYPWLDYKWGYSTGVPVKNPITTDVVSFIYPTQILSVEMLKRGELPLWNPYILAGTPLFANFQTASFSPTVILYFLLNTTTAWSIQIMLQHVLAALFVYLLLRFWHLTQAASVIGGIIYAFSGFNLIWSQWNGHTLSAAFIPLLILLADKYVAIRKMRYLIIFSFVICCQILSGYPQIVIYTAVALALLVMVSAKSVSDLIRLSIVVGVSALLGFGLASFQIFPGAELLVNSQRAIEPLEQSMAILPWSKLITFIAPDYYGNHATGNYWGPQDYTSNTGFVGVFAAVFAVCAVYVLKLKQRQNVYFVLLGFFGLFLSFPTFLSLFLWRSGLFGLQAASAHRALVLFNLSVAFLSAVGVDLFIHRTIRVKQFLASSATVAVVLGIFTIYTRNLTINGFGVNEASVATRNLVPPLLTLILVIGVFFVHKIITIRKAYVIGLLFMICSVELFRFGWKFTPFTSASLLFPETPMTRYLSSLDKPVRTTGNAVIPINLRMPYRIESLEGYDAIYPEAAASYVAAINAASANTTPQGRYAIIDRLVSPLLDVAGIGYVITLKYDEHGNPSPEGKINAELIKAGYMVAFEDKTTVALTNPKAYPRALLTNNYEVVSPEEVLPRLLANKTESILLNKELGLDRNKLTGSVRYDSYTENSSTLTVHASGKALLYVSDSYYPGWKVYIDGTQGEIVRANYLFRGVVIPAGVHKVDFAYDPDSFSYGVIASVLAVVALLFISALARFRGVY